MNGQNVGINGYMAFHDEARIERELNEVHIGQKRTDADFENTKENKLFNHNHLPVCTW